jgi:hypothetical protein
MNNNLDGLDINNQGFKTYLTVGFVHALRKKITFI